ncbi:MAG: hypothetical protein IPN48_08195 [Sphingomonadales bacterium]|nr:hypothetical protein [Sphingomonadales bacterium]
MIVFVIPLREMLLVNAMNTGLDIIYSFAFMRVRFGRSIPDDGESPLRATFDPEKGVVLFPRRNPD